MFIFVLLVIILVSLQLFYKFTYEYWKRKNVASPKPIPFFGNIIKSVLRKEHIGITYNDIYKSFPNEKIIGIYKILSPSLMVRDLDIIKNILITDFEDLSNRGTYYSKQGLGDNLFHCDDEVWKALRHKITPLFTSMRMKATVPLLETQANDFCKYIDFVISIKNEQEMGHLFDKYTMGTIMCFAFGIRIDNLNDNNIFSKIGYETFKINYWNEADMIFPGIMKKTNQSLFNKIVNKFCHEIAQAAVDVKNNMPSNRNDLIDVLLKFPTKPSKESVIENSELNANKQEFEVTNHVIASQILTFFIAGYGNNSSNLSYAMYYLANNQQIQAKLVKEIDDILNKHNGKLSYKSLNEMLYLDQVYYEVLRLHPITNSIQRSARTDYKIPGTDVVINKGTSIIISTYAIHRDEKYFSDPETFDPERFSPDMLTKRHPCAFLPFGTGPRSCIGRNFAKIQFGIAIVRFLQHFRVELPKNFKTLDICDPMRISLFPRRGIVLNIFSRK